MRSTIMGEASSRGWTGLLLAGGRSSRMGTDKATMLWRGETFLDRIHTTLGSVLGLERVVVSGDRKVVGAIPDRQAGLGPLGGIETAIGLVPEHGWLLVVPVDMPMLEAGDLRALVAAAAREQAPAVYYRDHELPCALLCDKFARSVLRNLCASGVDPRARSVSALLSALGAWALEPDRATASRLRNVNTREDWASLESHEASI